MRRLNVLVAALVAAATVVPAGAAPQPGDTYVYRVLNAYNNEVRGQIQYRIDKIDADRVEFAVTTDTPSLGTARTEIYTVDGNGLRRPLINHDQLHDYEFAIAYPAYVFPLETGKSWSMRVDAIDPVSGKRNSVRVDGEVLGSERVTTPAGTFDTIRVKRRVYAGDWESFRHETNITEIDWYAPALGRAVRSESNSGYIDTNRCGRLACDPIRGDWNLFELVKVTASNP